MGVGLVELAQLNLLLLLKSVLNILELGYLELIAGPNQILESVLDTPAGVLESLELFRELLQCASRIRFRSAKLESTPRFTAREASGPRAPASPPSSTSAASCSSVAPSSSLKTYR